MQPLRDTVQTRLPTDEGPGGKAVPVALGDTAPALRAADSDRRQTMALLQRHFVAGRLTAEELGERIDRALGALTLVQLDALVADLPALDIEPVSSSRQSAQSPLRENHRRPRRHAAIRPRPDRSLARVRGHAIRYAMVMSLLVVIWLVTSPGGYFWPIWPMLGWGIGLASHAMRASGCGRERRDDYDETYDRTAIAPLYQASASVCVVLLSKTSRRSSLT